MKNNLIVPTHDINTSMEYFIAPHVYAYDMNDKTMIRENSAHFIRQTTCGIDFGEFYEMMK